MYHYYPYGKLIENRTWEAEDARFGFQGQERDDEVAGAGNYIHYKARDYSALTSRMDRIDPLSDKFPSQSPYITSGNNPIYKIDIDGMQDGLPSVLAYPTLLGLNERHDDGIHTWGEISNDDEFAATRKAWLYAGAGGLFFAAVEVYGVEAVATFVAEEIAEECFENLTGMSPPPLDPFDFAQQGFKKAGKSFVADGTKQLGKRGVAEGVPNITKLTKAGNYPSWSTVRRRYWKVMNGGKVPTGTAKVRMRATGEIKNIKVSKELHHINGRTGADPHRFNNLKEVWPWEHQALDPYRHTGYDFIQWVK